MVATRRGVRVQSGSTNSDESSEVQATPPRRSQRTRPVQQPPPSPPGADPSPLRRCSRASRLHSPQQPCTPSGSVHEEESEVSDAESCCSAVSSLSAGGRSLRPRPRRLLDATSGAATPPGGRSRRRPAPGPDDGCSGVRSPLTRARTRAGSREPPSCDSDSFESGPPSPAGPTSLLRVAVERVRLQRSALEGEEEGESAPQEEEVKRASQEEEVKRASQEEEVKRASQEEEEGESAPQEDEEDSTLDDTVLADPECTLLEQEMTIALEGESTPQTEEEEEMEDEEVQDSGAPQGKVMEDEEVQDSGAPQGKEGEVVEDEEVQDSGAPQGKEGEVVEDEEVQDSGAPQGKEGEEILLTLVPVPDHQQALPPAVAEGAQQREPCGQTELPRDPPHSPQPTTGPVDPLLQEEEEMETQAEPPHPGAGCEEEPEAGQSGLPAPVPEPPQGGSSPARGSAELAQKKILISLLDSSEEEEEEESEGEGSEEEGEEGESRPSRSCAVTSVDGLFMIDTRPGQEGAGLMAEEEAELRAEEEGEEDFVDEEATDDEEDEDTQLLLSSCNPRSKEMSCSIDPGLRLKQVGGLYISFDGGKSKPTSSALKLKGRKIQDELLKKSVIGPEFEKQAACPVQSKRAVKKQHKTERNASAGGGWFDMKAPEVTPEIRADLRVLKMRAALDPKRFYKKNDRDGFPKYFQLGTVVDSPVDFYHSRVPKKKRKRTMVEELLVDAEFRLKNKRKYQQIMAEKTAQSAGKFKKKKGKFSKK